MVLSTVLYEAVGDISLQYQELLNKESLPLFEAVAVLVGKAYFDREEAEIYVKQDEFAQRIIQLAFESIMANSLVAKAHGDGFYVTPNAFIEWWASKGLSFPVRPKAIELSSETTELERSLSFREIVDAAKREIREIAHIIWRKNATWNADQVIESPNMQAAINKMENAIQREYDPKTYKSWISICDPRPKETRLGRPKKGLE